MPLAKGFEKKSFLTVRSEIEDALTDALGEVNLVAPSVFANIIAVFAERESQLWDMLEAVYNSAYPDTAEGYSLDAVCALNGITRLSATYSTAVAQITGINYTKIAKDTKVAVKGSGKVFLLEKDIILTNNKCYSIKLEIIHANSQEYKLSINGQEITYTKQAEDTKGQIAAGLALLINNMSTLVTATNDSANIAITTKEANTGFSCYVTIEDMRILEVTNNAGFLAAEVGAIAVPAYSLTEIKTPVSGFLSVTNAQSGITGTDIEGDAQLRARRKNSLSLSGSGTLDSIRAAILNITGVTSATLYENNTDTESPEGLPGHSFKALVAGGNDQQIANAIWQKKPAGIRSFGNVTVVVKDSNGKEHNISFSRSVKRYIYARVTITKDNTFIDDSVSVIKENIAAHINKLGAGNNVILKSLYCPVFEHSGIKAADIVIGSSLNEGQVPPLSNNDVIVDPEEVAFTDTAKIEIILQE